MSNLQLPKIRKLLMTSDPDGRWQTFKSEWTSQRNGTWPLIAGAGYTR